MAATTRTTIHLSDEDIITDDTQPTQRRAGLRLLAARRAAETLGGVQSFTSNIPSSTERGQKGFDSGLAYCPPSHPAGTNPIPLKFDEYNHKRKAKGHPPRTKSKVPRVHEDTISESSRCSSSECDDATHSATGNDSVEDVMTVPPDPHYDCSTSKPHDNSRTRRELFDVIKPFVLKAPDYMQCRMTAGSLQGLHSVISCIEGYQEWLDRSSEFCTEGDGADGSQPQLSDVSKIPKIQIRIAVLLFLAHVDVSRREMGDRLACTRLKQIERLLVPELLKEVKAIAGWLKSASSE